VIEEPSFFRRRIWSEDVPVDVISRPITLELARRFGLGLIVAVRPSDVQSVPRLLASATDQGVVVEVWPMLDDVDGRWVSASNAAEFAAFVRLIVSVVEREQCVLGGVALDLEPRIDDVRAAIDGRPRVLGLAGASARFASSLRVLGALVRDLVRDEVAVSAAAVPLVLLDPPKGAAWQVAMGTPVDALPLEHVSVMLYTSLIEGWSRGVLDRESVGAVLSEGARLTRLRFGRRAGVSLGAVGKGALGDEPVYRDVSELAQDVATARAQGVDDLALLDLGGVLARPNPEAWLEAFVATEAAKHVPPTPLAMRVALPVARAMSAAVSAFLRR